MGKPKGSICLKTLYLILILAAGLRLTGLTFDSLWLDESYQTVVESYGNNLPDLLNTTGYSFLYKPGSPASCRTVLANFRKVDPLCPPLYAMAINRWLTIFGGSDFALRGFSVLCSLLAIAATYCVAYLLLGRNAALYAALWQSISPLDIAYAQEARMYSLCTLWAVLSGGSFLYFICKMSDSLSGRLSNKSLLLAAIYVISMWALVNSHYTQLFIWFFAIVVGFFISFVRKDLLLFAWTVATNLCVFILCIPWLSFFLQAVHVQGASFYIIRQASIWWPVWGLLCRMPLNWLVFLVGKKVMFWAAPVYLTASCLIGYVLFRLITKNRATGQSAIGQPTGLVLRVLFAWALIPAIMVWGLDVFQSHRVIEIPRYLIGTAPAIYLLAGYGAFLLEKTRYYFLLVIVHASCCLANNAYMHIVPQKEDWRSMAQLVERVCHPNELLLVSHYYDIVCLDRYLNNPLKQVGVSPAMGSRRIEVILKNMLPADDSGSLITGTPEPPQHTFWVLTAQDGDAIFSIIPAGFKVIEKYNFPHALHLWHYQQERRK